MKKFFEEPEVEIIEFDATDILVTSGGTQGWDSGKPGKEQGGDTPTEMEPILTSSRKYQG